MPSPPDPPPRQARLRAARRRRSSPRPPLPTARTRPSLRRRVVPASLCDPHRGGVCALGAALHPTASASPSVRPTWARTRSGTSWSLAGPDQCIASLPRQIRTLPGSISRKVRAGGGLRARTERARCRTWRWWLRSRRRHFGRISLAPRLRVCEDDTTAGALVQLGCAKCPQLIAGHDTAVVRGPAQAAGLERRIARHGLDVYTAFGGHCKLWATLRLTARREVRAWARTAARALERGGYLACVPQPIVLREGRRNAGLPFGSDKSPVATMSPSLCHLASAPGPMAPAENARRSNLPNGLAGSIHKVKGAGGQRSGARPRVLAIDVIVTRGESVECRT